MSVCCSLCSVLCVLFSAITFSILVGVYRTGRTQECFTSHTLHFFRVNNQKHMKLLTENESLGKELEQARTKITDMTRELEASQAIIEVCHLFSVNTLNQYLSTISELNQYLS